MKKNKQPEERYGKLAESMVAYYDHLDLRGLDDLDDDAFACIMEKVRGVYMLDLNETGITNQGIKLLTRLEYVKEIRAKGCRLLDDNCITDLDTITSLEFLHVRYTGITIDGLLQLKSLTNLKTLMFSAGDVEAIKEKLLQLKAMLPQCELVIDAKPYYVNAVELFIQSIQKQPYSYRLKIKGQPLDAAWSHWLIKPGDNYIEAEAQGPYAVDDIEWVEINAIEKKSAGKLVAGKETDHTAAIIKLLDYLGFPYMITGGLISAYLVNKEI